MRKVKWIIEGYDDNDNIIYRTGVADDLSLLSMIIFFMKRKNYTKIVIRKR